MVSVLSRREKTLSRPYGNSFRGKGLPYRWVGTAFGDPSASDGLRDPHPPARTFPDE